MNRPSEKEKSNKIREAISAIESGKRIIPMSKHFASDQEDLGIKDSKNLWELLLVFLRKIEDLEPRRCYVGGRPPKKSYELEVAGKELWAYSWQSISMNKKMYIKFCLVGGYYFYVGCHEDNLKGAAR